MMTYKPLEKVMRSEREEEVRLGAEIVRTNDSADLCRPLSHAWLMTVDTLLPGWQAGRPPRSRHLNGYQAKLNLGRQLIKPAARVGYPTWSTDNQLFGILNRQRPAVLQAVFRPVALTCP